LQRNKRASWRRLYHHRRRHSRIIRDSSWRLTASPLKSEYEIAAGLWTTTNCWPMFGRPGRNRTGPHHVSRTQMVTQSHPKKKSKKRTGSQGRRKVDPPANPPAQELRKISAREFAARFANGVQGAQQSFTWFLGAGCSKSSGILDAGGLVEQWLTEQHEFEADTEELATWIRRTNANRQRRSPSGFVSAVRYMSIILTLIS
jgi:hypothetical protein